MNYQPFLLWLCEEKKMSDRLGRDIVSRLRRAIRLLQTKDIHETSVEILNRIPAFSECTVFVKSHLRRSVRLYHEFLTTENQK